MEWKILWMAPTHFIFSLTIPTQIFITFFLLLRSTFSSDPPHILFFYEPPSSHFILFYFIFVLQTTPTHFNLWFPFCPPMRIKNGIALTMQRQYLRGNIPSTSFSRRWQYYGLSPGPVDSLAYLPKAPSTYWGKITQGPIHILPIWGTTLFTKRSYIFFIDFSWWPSLRVSDPGGPPILVKNDTSLKCNFLSVKSVRVVDFNFLRLCMNQSIYVRQTIQIVPIWVSYAVLRSPLSLLTMSWVQWPQAQ